MSSNELLQGFFALLSGGALALGLYLKNNPELRPDKRWGTVVTPWLLPLFLILLLVMLPITGAGNSLPMLGAMCLGIFLHMSVYYVLLIAVGPLLRRWISAGACAVLWLLPNFLYICQHRLMRRSAPKWIIWLQGEWLRSAVLVWLAGVAAILLWKCIEHLLFRRKLLDSAWPERDGVINETWTDMQRNAKIKKADIPLLRSREVVSPMSVGLFRSSTFVVLPETEYTVEELELILRHELIHIIRRDAQTKMFLTFCTAVCWFNPLMWVAIRRCAEDLELSCDELVLENADGTEKNRYANLILRCAGESRGFTSNLAPTTASLRYRLKQIMSPGRRLTGGITAGLVLFLLLMTSGITAFAYGGGTVAEQVFEDQLPAVDRLDTVAFGTRNEYGGIQLLPCTCTDPAALIDYLSGLEVYRLSGNYELQGEGYFLEFWLPGSGGPKILMLEEHCLKLTDLGAKRALTELWYLDNPPDWIYIQSLLTEREKRESIPQPPNMEIIFGSESIIDGAPFIVTGKILENTLDGEPSELFAYWEDSPCVVEGVPVEWADINFHIEVPPDELTVMAWNPEQTECKSADMYKNQRIALLPCSAHYTVEARWEFGTDIGTQVYRMEYAFDVVWPEE
jgi:hypothetical protein